MMCSCLRSVRRPILLLFANRVVAMVVVGPSDAADAALCTATADASDSPPPPRPTARRPTKSKQPPPPPLLCRGLRTDRSSESVRQTNAATRVCASLPVALRRPSVCSREGSVECLPDAAAASAASVSAGSV